MEVPADLDVWLAGALFHHLLVFARIGTALIMLPGFADSGIPQRERLAAGLGLAFAMTPTLAPRLPETPGDPVALAMDIAAEITVGGFFGTVVRLLIGALHISGVAMAQNMMLSNIFGGSGVAFMGASSLSATLILGGVVVIFASGLHLPMLAAVLESYEVIPPTRFPDPALLGRMAERGGLKMFELAAQLAGPFIALGFLVKMAMGFINRANSKMPVFFVLIPFVVGGGLVLLALVTPALMNEFEAEFAEWIRMLHGL